jgi:hypothetical protein
MDPHVKMLEEPLSLGEYPLDPGLRREGALEVESVLEGLDLADLHVFAGSNSGSATVINLWCTSVGQWAMIPEGARTSWVT